MRQNCLFCTADCGLKTSMLRTLLTCFVASVTDAQHCASQQAQSRLASNVHNTALFHQIPSHLRAKLSSCWHQLRQWQWCRRSVLPSDYLWVLERPYALHDAPRPAVCCAGQLHVRPCACQGSDPPALVSAAAAPSLLTGFAEVQALAAGH